MSDPAGAAQTREATGPREELLAKLRERILGFAASRLQRDAAEDLAQEVLVLLHRNIPISTASTTCSRSRCKSCVLR